MTGRTSRSSRSKDRQVEKPTLTIPVHTDLKLRLDAWKAESAARKTPTTHILTSPRGLPWTPPYPRRVLTEQVKALAFGRLTVHGFRKPCATCVAEAGCTAHQIVAAGGWRTLAMVQHYDRSADQEDLARAAIVTLEGAKRENAENT
ncbi:hypothetical protein GCM10011504_26680 [Siccirubricoccus deserti]|uniref:Tyrosine-type recombinase/integrase n=1 Tax=Siccirubricoccus deserti TaxID=2013562 RepID=A0A9X0QZ31_9PROT|nr:tyrosine-type recombinase/integrase [Siccirubricoccus deserti]GGC46882.1 hypothetical protein GCM10011504_26680 [Siccirubricoccus deserti]